MSPSGAHGQITSRTGLINGIFGTSFSSQNLWSGCYLLACLLAFAFNPDPESRIFQTQSRIPNFSNSIPNPEIFKLNPESRIPKSQISIPNPDPEFRDRDFVGIVGISIPNAGL